MATGTETVRISPMTFSLVKDKNLGCILRRYQESAVHNHRTGMIEIQVPSDVHDALCVQAEEICMDMEEMIGGSMRIRHNWFYEGDGFIKN